MPSREHEELVAVMVEQVNVEVATIDEMRSGFEEMMEQLTPPVTANVNPISIDGLAADLITAANSRNTRAVLYLHGGGYIIGSKKTHRELCSRIAEVTEAQVLVIDYRLAPENPFPAAVDDAVKAYQYLIDEGISTSQIMIAGDSAGGGLSLATMLSLKSRDESLPACACLFSPWVDLTCSGDTQVPGVADDPMLTKEKLREMASAYAPGNFENPIASPLFADLTALPPLLIFCGTREVLLSDSKKLAEKAISSGVHVELHVKEGLVHVWQTLPVPEAAESLATIKSFTAKHM
ncbi:MAG: alpha/beta hydrolase [Pseudomonadota bacterium]